MGAPLEGPITEFPMGSCDLYLRPCTPPTHQLAQTTWCTWMKAWGPKSNITDVASVTWLRKWREWLLSFSWRWQWVQVSSWLPTDLRWTGTGQQTMKNIWKGESPALKNDLDNGFSYSRYRSITRWNRDIFLQQADLQVVYPKRKILFFAKTEKIFDKNVVFPLSSPCMPMFCSLTCLQIQRKKICTKFDRHVRKHYRCPIPNGKHITLLSSKAVLRNHSKQENLSERPFNKSSDVEERHLIGWQFCKSRNWT